MSLIKLDYTRYDRIASNNKNLQKIIGKLLGTSYTYIKLREVRENKRQIVQPTKVSNLSNRNNKFSLTIDTFYYIHFFRKVNEKSQNEKNYKAVNGV